MSEKSCVGCKFMYIWDEGYSNYTVDDHTVYCAKDKNPNLPASQPCDWIESPDNWPKTWGSRCGLYDQGLTVVLDVDGEAGVADDTDDEEQIQAICEHSGRERNGHTAP